MAKQQEAAEHALQAIQAQLDSKDGALAAAATKNDRLAAEKRDKDQELQHYAGLVLGLAEHGKKGADQPAAPGKANPNNNKWTKGQAAGQPSADDSAARRRQE